MDVLLRCCSLDIYLRIRYFGGRSHICPFSHEKRQFSTTEVSFFQKPARRLYICTDRDRKLKVVWYPPDQNHPHTKSSRIGPPLLGLGWIYHPSTTPHDPLRALKQREIRPKQPSFSLFAPLSARWLVWYPPDQNHPHNKSSRTGPPLLGLGWVYHPSTTPHDPLRAPKQREISPKKQFFFVRPLIR